MWAEGAAVTWAANLPTTGPSTSAARRSNLEIMPSEIVRPNRSEASCWIGRLPRRYEPASMARIARKRGPNGPVGTPAGNSAGGDPTPGASQVVEAILIDIRSHGRDLGDLVPQRFGVMAVQRGPVAAALRRLDLEGVPELLGWDQGSGMSVDGRVARSDSAPKAGRVVAA